jgi:hypothetical protein
MPDKQQLLESILRSPDDDAPRDAYAEILAKENPRRRYISLQLGLAHLNRNQERKEWLDSRSETELLLLQHKQEWRPDWPTEASRVVKDYWFHRGFVGLIAISAADFLQHGGTLLAHAPIRHLNIVADGETPALFFESEYLRNVRSLSFTSCGLQDEDIIAMILYGALDDLRWLDLAYNNISTEAVVALCESPLGHNLRYVNLMGNPGDFSARLSTDGDFITDTWLPDQGQQIEEQLGQISWLHVRASSILDIVPDRFMLGINWEGEGPQRRGFLVSSGGSYADAKRVKDTEPAREFQLADR